MPNGHLFEIHAREKANMPDEWRAYYWECLPHGKPSEYYQFTGAVVPIHVGGPLNGLPNWTRKDAATWRTVEFTAEEHKAFCADWEKRTGKCNECMGKGETIASSGVSGTKYRECHRCKGSGRPPEETP